MIARRVAIVWIVALALFWLGSQGKIHLMPVQGDAATLAEMRAQFLSLPFRGSDHANDDIKVINHGGPVAVTRSFSTSLSSEQVF